MRLNPYLFFLSKYDVYSDGTICHKKRKKALRPARVKSRSGNYYHLVSFRMLGQKVNLLVNRIVCYKFNPITCRQLTYMQADHINRDTTDNRRENLRWLTITENNKRRVYL